MDIHKGAGRVSRLVVAIERSFMDVPWAAQQKKARKVLLFGNTSP